MGMTSRSEDKPTRRKGGHLCPPDRMCNFCWRKMPPADTLEACLDCQGEWRRMQAMRQQIHTVFEVTKTMSLSAIFKVLWDFKWKHRNQ
jgi:hypothetical protein